MSRTAAQFLSDEHDAWRPYEALAGLGDADLERPLDAAHGWSGRDLMAHLLAWQEIAIRAARELAVAETSATLAALDADWEIRGGEAVNAGIQATWGSLPLADLRARFRDQPAELREVLSGMPESRWLGHPEHGQTFVDETIGHYGDHLDELGAIIAAAG